MLDLTRFFSGPQCTLFLAGMGAEVIKVDDPKGGDPTAFAPPFAGPDGISFEKQSDRDMGLMYLKRARGKKSTMLNLKSDEGRQIFLRLVAHADVVVENFSVGVTKRLGIDYETLASVNPRIIYCSLTGYGATGPDRDAKAYDLMVQASVGLMSITGLPEGPPVKAASPLSDAIAGMFAAHGIVAALLHRERTGQGQAIDVSMADCLFSLVFDEPFDCYARLGIEPRQANRAMRFSPFNTFQARDGWVAIGVATSEQWMQLLDVMGVAKSKQRDDLMNLGWRLANNAAVDEIVTAWTMQRTRQEIIDLLSRAKVPCSSVRSIDEVMQWAHLHEREMIKPLWNPIAQEEMQAFAPGFPIKFSQTPARYDEAAPTPGEHTEDVLGRFAGLTTADLRGLRERGVV